MTTMIIEDNSVQAKHFIKFASTLPFATIIEPPKKSFAEACAECDGRPASEFFDELKRQVKEYYKNA